MFAYYYDKSLGTLRRVSENGCEFLRYGNWLPSIWTEQQCKRNKYFIKLK